MRWIAFAPPSMPAPTSVFGRADDPRGSGAVVREAPGPMLLNLVTNGATPKLPCERVRELGYRFAIWPTTAAIAAALAIGHAFELLEREGTDEPVVEGLAPRELFAVVGLDEAIAVDRRSGSASLTNS